MGIHSLLVLLVVNLCKGHIQGFFGFCVPSISANTPFPEEDEKLIITANTCPQNENSTIVWSMCGEIVGTCVRESCTVDNIENDPSDLKSSFTIKKTSIARDNCLLTFKADDIRLSHRINIYKHPEKFYVTANGKRDNNSQVDATEPITLEVKTSCMYPRPLINVYFKDKDYGLRLILKQRNSDIDDMEESCKVMEVATSTAFHINPLCRVGYLSVELVYGNYQRDIFTLKIENKTASDNIGEPFKMPIKVEDFVLLSFVILYHLSQYISEDYKIKKADNIGCVCDYLQYPHSGICLASKKDRWLKNVLYYSFHIIFHGPLIFTVMKLAISKKWTSLEISLSSMLAVIIVIVGLPYVCERLRVIGSVKGKIKPEREEMGTESESEEERIPLT